MMVKMDIRVFFPPKTVFFPPEIVGFFYKRVIFCRPEGVPGGGSCPPVLSPRLPRARTTAKLVVCHLALQAHALVDTVSGLGAPNILHIERQ